ncbi:MAG TPA: hypothetical protein VJH65_01555 [Candidatus Nanoarchaeia archaeon]|nr:hypothetical protein [Candidatus Nanoarchaeia archaeon]
MEGEIEKQLKTILAELRKENQRKFDQTVDLIINLQKYDVRKNPLNLFLNIPNKIKDKKIAGFLEAKHKDIDTITLEQFKKYTDKKSIKKLVKDYDFFIAQASIMPKVATTFGRILGPVGKMPSPQLGVIVNVNDKIISELKEKINHSVKIKVKEPSIKLPIGKESMKDEQIIENITNIYNNIVKELPRNKDNIKNIEIKFTMTKPRKIKMI